MAARLGRNGDAWVALCPVHGELLTDPDRVSAGLAAARHAACPDDGERQARQLASRRALHAFLRRRFEEDRATPPAIAAVTHPAVEHSPHQLLEAKQRLVDAAAEFHSDDHSLHAAIDTICRMLAAPYAQHPDFLPEWAT